YTSASQLRTSSSPRAVISPGSPGPAPTRYTLIPGPPESATHSLGFSCQRLLDERLEVVAPLLVASVVLLGPRAKLLETLRQLGVRRRQRRGDVVADPLGERRRRASGRDRDGDRPFAVDGRKDEVAEVGHVGDVAQHPAFFSIAVNALVHGAI